MSRWLRAALSALNEEEHKVVAHKWMDGLTLKQVAQRAHMSIGKVKTLHGNGLDKMCTCLRFVENENLQLVA
jgi:DNA-directed RNA polymerase specialized sigma24 family protein